MKYKAKLRNLEGRIKNWEQIPKNIQGAYCKPGSEKK